MPYRYIIAWCLSLLGCIYSSMANAQNFLLTQYTTKDKLPSNNFYHVYRDKMGFLWFSSDKGLVRYNGINFETFTTFNGLPDNEIFFVQEDIEGRLWLSSFNGELCFFKNDVFYTQKNKPFLKLPFKTSHIFYINSEVDSSITISFRQFPLFVNIKKDSCYLFDKRKLTGVIDQEELYFLKLTNNVFKFVYLDKIIETTAKITTEKTQPYNTKTLRINQDQRYLVDQNHIYNINGTPQFTFTRKKENIADIRSIYKRDTDIFIAYSDGLYLNDSTPILTNTFVTGITQDIEGDYWISTKEKGIYRLSSNFQNNKEYKNIYTKSIQFAQMYDNKIIYTTANGIFSFKNGMAKCFIKYPFNTNNINDYNISQINNGVMYNYSNNRNYTLKSITDNPQISEYKIDRLWTLKKAIIVDSIVYLQEIDAIWSINYNQITQKNKLKLYPIVSKETQNRIFDMNMDSNGTIWYSTINKLYKWHNNKRQSLPLSNDVSFKWFELMGNTLVGCTHHNQLQVWHNYQNNNPHIDTILYHNCIWEKSYRLDSTHLLISTNSNYRILNIAPLKDSIYYTVQTVENPFIPLHAEYICVDNTNCYFFKNGSISSIVLSEIFRKPSSSKIFITSIKTRTQAYYPNNADSFVIKIPYNESRNLRIKYIARSFRNVLPTYEYSFSKENKHTTWQQVIGEEIQIIEPNYGEYVLKLRIKDLSGNNIQPTIAYIVISPPFWRSWYFISVCILIVLILLYLLQQYIVRINVQKKEKEHAAKIGFLKMEYKALNALMNPHFIFNCLNNIQSLINEGDKVSANEYLKYFSELVRQNMRNISKELISLQMEIDLVTNYLKLEKLRFGDDLDYSISIDTDVDTDMVLVPPLLIQPLVENSIKHGLFNKIKRNNLISIRVKEDKDIIIVEIEDNGVGLMNKKGEANHESYGLTNINMRIEQIKQINNYNVTFQLTELLDENNNINGTIAILKFHT